MALGDEVTDWTDGRVYVVIFDGGRGQSLLPERRERMNEVYGYGFEITRRAPWVGQRVRKPRKRTEDV